MLWAKVIGSVFRACSNMPQHVTATPTVAQLCNREWSCGTSGGSPVGCDAERIKPVTLSRSPRIARHPGPWPASEELASGEETERFCPLNNLARFTRTEARPCRQTTHWVWQETPLPLARRRSFQCPAALQFCPNRAQSSLAN